MVILRHAVDGILTVDTAPLTVALGDLSPNLGAGSLTRPGWRPLAPGLLISVVVAAASLALIVGARSLRHLWPEGG